jgi:drug/metabolite transporter (DMT)-like permease
MLLNPSDAITITHTSIIITAVLARIFLNEKITLAHFIALILTVIGVLFICKPSFLFGNQNNHLHAKSSSLNSATNLTNCSLGLSNATSTVNNSNTSNINATLNDCTKQKAAGILAEINSEVRVAIGISLTFLGAIASSLVYLVLKKLSNSKVHWASNTIYVCWFGIPFSIIISAVLIKLGHVHKDFEKEKPDLPMDLFYSCLASCMSIIGQIFLNNSLKYEDATKIAIVRTVG